MRGPVVLVVVCALAGCQGGGEPAEGEAPAPAARPSAPPLEVGALRPGDRARVVRDGYGARVEVESAEGIGELELTRPIGEPWPPTVVLRFQALQALESFSAGTVGREADLTAKGQLAHGAESSTSDGPLGLRFARRQGFIEVTLPAALLEPGSGTLRVSWVDYLR